MIHQRREATVQTREIRIAHVDGSTRQSRRARVASSFTADRRSFFVERIQRFCKWATIHALNSGPYLCTKFSDPVYSIERLLHAAIGFEREIELLRQIGKRGLYARIDLHG